MSFTLYNLAKHTFNEKDTKANNSFLAICLGYPGATVTPLFSKNTYYIDPRPFEFVVVNDEKGIYLSIEVLFNSTFRITCDFNKQIIYYFPN